MSQPDPRELEKLVNSRKDELSKIAKQIGATSLEQVFDFLAGRDRSVTNQMKSDIGRGLSAISGGHLDKTIGRFAGSVPVSIGLRTLPAVTAVGALLGTGDVLLGDASGGNKVMDAASMMAAGAYGGHKRGMYGGLAGMAAGKVGSDVLQALLGGGN